MEFIVGGVTQRVTAVKLATAEVKYGTRVVTRLVPRTTTNTTMSVATDTGDGGAEGHADDGLGGAVIASITVVGVLFCCGLAFLVCVIATKKQPCAPKKVHPGVLSARSRKISVQENNLMVDDPRTGPAAPTRGPMQVLSQQWVRNNEADASRKQSQVRPGKRPLPLTPPKRQCGMNSFSRAAQTRAAREMNLQPR